MRQFKINEEKYASIPPGSENHKITGILTLRVEIKYLNSFREAVSLRCKFWGMNVNGLNFENVQDTEKVLNLNIRSNLERTSKYFKDMKGLCI